MFNGYTYILLSALIFSTMEIAGKLASYNVNPFQLNFLRFLIGAIILLPFALKDLKKRNIEINKADILYFLITGLLCILISMSFFQLSIIYTKASTVAIVFSTNPVFTIPFAYYLLKEKLNKATVVSLVASMLGLLCILNPFNLDADIKGIIFAILAAASFSCYSVIGKKRSDRYGSIALNCFTFLFGDLIMLLFIGISHLKFFSKFALKNSLTEFANIPIFFGVNSHNIAVIIYLGIVVTGLGYLFYFLAMEKTDATTASIVFFIKPALAPILSLIILSEQIQINKILGILFIIFGSYISLKGKKVKNI